MKKLALILIAATLFAAPAMAAELSPNSERLARDINIIPLIDKIHELQKKENPPAVEMLSLVQKMDYQLTITSLQIEDVLSAIDEEDTRADEMRFVLQSKADRALKLNSLANIVGSGALACLGSSLSISNNSVGNVVSTTAGGVNAGIASVAYKQQVDEGGALKHYGVHPNMLAMIFGFKPDENTTIPTVVWNYLNSSEDNGKETRKEKLIRSWVQLGRIPSPQTAKGHAEVALIAGEVGGSHQLTVSILDDRSAMLSDLRAAISKMKRNLLELMLALEPEQ
jgi:hypothetical protein